MVLFELITLFLWFSKEDIKYWMPVDQYIGGVSTLSYITLFVFYESAKL